ncbi:hypothetical protein M0802_016896 [Mischocyttarus mexicanus]|nr:hypothetical protein M0802_016896 [Mischocyttarus mexicanus]
MFPPVLTTEEVGAGPHAQGQRMTHPGHTGHALKFGAEGGHSARAHPFMTKGKTGMVGWLLVDHPTGQRSPNYWDTFGEWSLFLSGIYTYMYLPTL